MFSISIKFHLDTINESMLSRENSLSMSSIILEEVAISPFIVFANASSNEALHNNVGSVV